MLGEKNLFPPFPKEVEEFENMAVKLIKDGICTQGDLQNLVFYSRKIDKAECDRRKAEYDGLGELFIKILETKGKGGEE